MSTYKIHKILMDSEVKDFDDLLGHLSGDLGDKLRLSIRPINAKDFFGVEKTRGDYSVGVLYYVDENNQVLISELGAHPHKTNLFYEFSERFT